MNFTYVYRLLHLNHNYELTSGVLLHWVPEFVVSSTVTESDVAGCGPKFMHVSRSSHSRYSGASSSVKG